MSDVPVTVVKVFVSDYLYKKKKSSDLERYSDFKLRIILNYCDSTNQSPDDT